METSDRVLCERVPKGRKERRKNSSPDVSPVIETPKNNNPNMKESIRLQIPANPSTPVPTHLTQSNFDFSPPGFPAYECGPEYLEMVKRTVQLIAHASRLHSALYEKPTNKQTHERAPTYGESASIATEGGQWPGQRGGGRIWELYLRI